MNNIEEVKNEIDIKDILKKLWEGKWVIAVISFIFCVGSVFYSLQLPDIYKSEVTLVSSEDNGLKLAGELGGLAALAGVNLGGKGVDKKSLALEILKSRDFITRFIEANHLYVPVMASKGWDRKSNKILIDSTIFIESTGEWVREVKEPFKPKPSNLETYEEFKKILIVNEDKASGIIKLSIEHYSPYVAKEWIDLLVKTINEEMRSRDLVEAENSINYLNKQLAETNVADVRSMLFSLIEEQTKTVMLANVREEYVFKTIDPAIVSEKKSKPMRGLIVVSSTMLGFFLAMLLVFLRKVK